MRSRLFKFALAAIIVAGIALFVTGFLLHAEKYLVKLPDGSEVRIVQMTYGREHRFVPGPPWQRLLKYLPLRVATLLGVPVIIDSTIEDTLLIWIEWKNHPTPLPNSQKICLVDTNGLSGLDILGSRSITKTGSVLTAFRLSNFPRHQPSLQLQWFVGNLTTTSPLARQFGFVSIPPPQFPIDPLAQFQVHNPCRTRQPLPGIKQYPTITNVDGERFDWLQFIQA